MFPKSKRPPEGPAGAGSGRERGCSRVSDRAAEDRKSTRLNSSHLGISYAVFCLKKKNKVTYRHRDATTAHRADETLPPDQPQDADAAVSASSESQLMAHRIPQAHVRTRLQGLHR